MRSTTVIFALLLIGCDPVAVRQTTTSPKVSASIRKPLHLQWDHVALDTAGGPVEISNYRIAVTPKNSPAPPVGVTVKAAYVAEDEGHRIALDTLLAELPPGEYQLRVQAVGASGKRSSWSTPFAVGWDGTAAIPAASPGASGETRRP